MGGEFNLRVKKTAGEQIFGILEGPLAGPAAWKVIQWLEGLGETPGEVVLDLSGISTADWLGIRILMDGIQALPRNKERISLRGLSKDLRCLYGGEDQS